MAYERTSRTKRRLERESPGRIVAVGDSLTAGVLDVWTNTRVLPWPTLLARLVDRPGVTNLARPGAGIAQVWAEQLPACRPEAGDLVGMWVGANDIFGRRFDDRGLVRAVHGLADTLAGSGGRLLTMQLPPVSDVLPLPGAVLRRFDERCALVNDALAEVGRRHAGVHLPWVPGHGLRGPDGVHLTQRGHATYALRYSAVLTGGSVGPAEPAQVFPELELTDTSAWSRRWWYLTSAPRWGLRRWVNGHNVHRPDRPPTNGRWPDRSRRTGCGSGLVLGARE